MDSNEPRPGTTDYFARIGFRAELASKAHQGVEDSLNALEHDDLIRLVEAHGMDTVARMAVEAAALAMEMTHERQPESLRPRRETLREAHQDKGHPSGWLPRGMQPGASS